jgi:hypothetical protein
MGRYRRGSREEAGEHYPLEKFFGGPHLREVWVCITEDVVAVNLSYKQKITNNLVICILSRWLGADHYHRQVPADNACHTL